MRVVLIGPVYPLRGGIAHYTTMLHRAMKAAGHDVLLVSFSRQYPQWLFPGESDRDPSNAAMVVSDAQFWIDSLNPLTWLSSFVKIRRFRPNVVVLQWWSAYWSLVWFLLAVLNALFLRAKWIYMCHNVVHHEATWLNATLSRVGLCWGDAYLVHSESERKALRQMFPDAYATVRPIPTYGLSFEACPSQEEARSQLGFDPCVPILLFFGFVRAYKGLDDLIAALPFVLRSQPQLKLVVAGEFWEDRERYLELIAELSIEDSVVIEDRYIPNEEVPLYFSAADILVAPYKSVTGSAVVQLGRAFGLPIVATYVGGMMEVADSDARVTLVSPGDIIDLADAILTVLDSLRQRDRTKPATGVLSDEHVRAEWIDLAQTVLHLQSRNQ